MREASFGDSLFPGENQLFREMYDQRIADAAEKMAMRHTELISDRDMYKKWYEQERALALHLNRSNNALRGQITKLKRQLASAKGQPS